MFKHAMRYFMIQLYFQKFWSDFTRPTFRSLVHISSKKKRGKGEFFLQIAPAFKLYWDVLGTVSTLYGDYGILAVLLSIFCSVGCPPTFKTVSWRGIPFRLRKNCDVSVKL